MRRGDQTCTWQLREGYIEVGTKERLSSGQRRERFVTTRFRTCSLSRRSSTTPLRLTLTGRIEPRPGGQGGGGSGWRWRRRVAAVAVAEAAAVAAVAAGASSANPRKKAPRPPKRKRPRGHRSHHRDRRSQSVGSERRRVGHIRYYQGTLIIAPGLHSSSDRRVSVCRPQRRVPSNSLNRQQLCDLHRRRLRCPLTDINVIEQVGGSAGGDASGGGAFDR